MEDVFTPAYKGIIFDLDGTLINSLEDLTDALNQVMKRYGCPLKTYEEGRRLIGRGLKNLVFRALGAPLNQDEALVEEALALMKAEYAKRYVYKTQPYEGIRDLLRYLHVHRIPFAVCTNKPDAAAKKIVETLFEDDTFVAVVGQNEGKPRKPDPTQTLEVAAKMGVAPGECIYMGDSMVDYETAKNAGMLPVLCTWGFEDQEKLLACGDAIWIKNPLRAADALKYGHKMYEIFNEKKESQLKQQD
ncbi:MAG: HAD-IA family hydrolase [Eubacterium sp.]|nr:HAD-IA family hydrolase [Eubacterium sp.]